MSAATDSAQLIRQLKIKTGVVKRLFKEEGIYREEVTTAKVNLAKLQDDGADPADIRQAERIVADSEQMVPRTQKELETALIALKDMVDALKSEAEVSGTEEYKNAEAAVAQVEDAHKTNGA